MSTAHNLNIVSLLGLDKNILKHSPLKEQKKYVLISRIVLLNLLLSFVGVVYLFYLLFGSLWVAILISAFWSLIFWNLQRFVFESVSGKRINLGVFIGIVFKLTVFSFFAVMSAFPVQLFLQQNAIEQHLVLLRKQKQKELEKDLDLIAKSDRQLLEQKIAKLQGEIDYKKNYIEEQYARLSETNEDILEQEIVNNIKIQKTELEGIGKVNNSYIDDYQKELSQIDVKKQKELKYYQSIIQHSSLIIERGVFLLSQKTVFSYTVYVLFILLFWFPILFKQKASYSYTYDLKKRALEREFVHREFQHFKENYRAIGLNLVGKEFKYPE